MKTRKIEVPTIYFRDCKEPEYLDISDKRLSDCIPLLTRIGRVKKEYNSFSIELFLARNPIIDKLETYLFTLNENAGKTLFAEILNETEVDDIYRTMNRKVLGYISKESDLVRAIQPKY
jgi:hypothetical protein